MNPIKANPAVQQVWKIKKAQIQAKSFSNHFNVKHHVTIDQWEKSTSKWVVKSIGKSIEGKLRN